MHKVQLNLHKLSLCIYSRMFFFLSDGLCFCVYFNVFYVEDDNNMCCVGVIYFCLFCSAGDQAGTEICAEVLGGTRHVVQVSTGPLLWSVVYLPAHICPGWEHQGAGTADCLWGAQAHGDTEGCATWRGETSYQPQTHNMSVTKPFYMTPEYTTSLYPLSSRDEQCQCCLLN